VIFYGEELLAPRPTPKLEGHPLSAVRDCLFNIFTATLHPQPEDAPCCGDNGPTEHGADTAINKINESEQKYTSQIIGTRLTTKKHPRKSVQPKEKKSDFYEKLIYNTKQKLVQNHQRITKSDKGNALITLREDDYTYSYIEDFIS
jgi:hypothetical protein